MRTSHRITLAATAAALVALLAGCSGARDGSGGQDAMNAANPAGQSVPAQGAGAPDSSSGESAADAGGDQAGVPTASDRQVIITGTLTIEAADPVAAADKAVTITTKAGGYVAARDDSGSTDDGTASATLTLKVPSGRVDGAAAQLTGLGELLSESWNREDVTSTVVDLDARITTLRTSIERLQEMMKQATKVDDLIRLEQELTSRQADLESMLAQRASLGNAVDYATITVWIQPPGAPSAVEQTGFTGAVASGWHALVTTVRIIVVALGYLVPWLVIAALIIVPAVWARRRYRARHPKPAPALAPAPPLGYPLPTPVPPQATAAPQGQPGMPASAPRDATAQGPGPVTAAQAASPDPGAPDAPALPPAPSDQGATTDKPQDPRDI